MIKTGGRFFSILLIFSFLINPIYAKNIKEKPTLITVTEKEFQVDGVGKKTPVFQVTFTHPDGSKDTKGYFGHIGDMFNAIVENKTSVPITMHWHGFIVPNDQDGVPGVTQLLIPPGQNKHYNYRLLQSGTYWMHSHQKFQEQNQLSAPMIIYDYQDKYKGLQEVVMYLEDFTYNNPQMLFDDLRQSKMIMDHANHHIDLNDIKYDAFLTNKRTFNNPDIILVEHGKKVRIRIINASSSTNFTIDTGKLAAKLIAVDGQNLLHPIKSRLFPISVGNRVDLILEIPKSEGAYPIKSLVEGTNKQTGLILKTSNAVVPKISNSTNQPAGRIDYYGLEKKLTGANSLVDKKINIHLHYVLGGKMQGYIWTLNNQSWPNITPGIINFGDRVEITYENKTSMSHPMHLHGHLFQVTEIDGKSFKGAMRDSILVQPFSTVKIQFDALNPGLWVNHCHNLYHLNAGMLAVVEYQHYPKPDFWIKADHKK